MDLSRWTSSAELTSLHRRIPPVSSIRNAIIELLFVVSKPVPDAESYETSEPTHIDQLLEVRSRLIAADPGEGIATEY